MNPTGGRSRLLASCAIAASLVAVGRALPAQAQAFQGVPVTVSGSASVTRSPGLDTIDVSTPQAVIDWTPEDTASPTIDFLPNGAQARYIGAPGLADFTVLNRILPASPSQIVAFNGSVISRLQDSIGNQTTGGAVWFYTPGGILVGATATFDVGGLLLTTADPVRNGFGDFLFGNTAQLRAAPGSLSGITIAPGARIDALPEDSYLALVAPRISHSGTATVNGGAAYIAAEAVDITINRGTFDIGVVTGTAANGNALVHDGVTTGPATIDLSDPHRVYMVAVPQNEAITMLVSGRAGFAPATDVSLENGAVILSAGRSVFFDQTNSTPIGAAEADIRITGGDFTSRLVADSSGSTKAGSETANLNFGADVTLSANRTAELRAVTGTVSVGGKALIRSAVGDRTAGTAAIVADAGTTLTIAGDAEVIADGGDDFRFNMLPGDIGRGGIARITSLGTIQIGGRAAVSAQGRGRFGFAIDGSQAFGGDAAILAQAGGRIDIGLGALVLGDAFGGGSDSAASGNVQGGIATIAADGGTIDIGGPATLLALASTSGGVTAGGAGTGGRATLAADNGGAVRIGADVDLNASGNGAFASGTGGAGTGGTAEIRTSLGGAITASAALHADAHGFSGSGASSGDARGGTVTVALNGGSMDVAGFLSLNAHAATPSSGGTGGRAFGGTVSLNATSTSLTLADDSRFDVRASGANGLSGGDATGGSVSILSTGSMLAFGPRLDIDISATGGSGSAGTHGAGIAGTASIRSTGDGVSSGSIAGAELDIFGYGDGGNGFGSTSGNAGGVGRGGGLSITTGTGSIGFGDAFIDLSGRGGQGSDSSSIGGFGGSGFGGTLNLDAGGGDLSFSTLFAFTDGQSGFGGDGVSTGGIGGSATGGSVTVFAHAGTLSLGDANLAARAFAGSGGGSLSGATANAGTGLGGSVLAGVEGGTARLTGNNVSLFVDALGHDATGGTGRIEARLGSIQIADAFVGARGDGTGNGLATGGNAGLATLQGDVTLTALSFEAGANGGIPSNGIDGGDAQGGVASITIGDGAVTTGSVFARAFGQGASGGTSASGNGGVGGDGRGGTVTVETVGVGGLTVTSNGFFGAEGIGGSGGLATAGGTGGNGGLGIGGIVMITSTAAAMDFGSANANVSGFGGSGGNGALGGAGDIGRGGSIAVRADGAAIHGDLFLGAEGQGGSGGVADVGAGGVGGDGFGGDIQVSGRTGSIVDGAAINLVANARGGFGGSGGSGPTGGAGGAGGNATGGVTRLTGLVQFDNSHLGAFASGGGGGNGGAGTDVGNSGGSGGAGGNASGGIAEARAFEGDMALGDFFADAFAGGGQGGFGGSGAPDTLGMSIIAAGGVGGNGLGGTARILIGSDPANPAPPPAGNFMAASADLYAEGVGGFGFDADGGDGHGGTAAILMNGGIASLSDFGVMTARGSGGAGNVGGDAAGGSAIVSVVGGTLDLGANRFIEADAFGGDGNITGSATGGSATLDIGGGAITVQDLTVSATATGGYAPNIAGAATGGTALVRASGGMLEARSLRVSATAFGGEGIVAPPPPSNPPSTTPSTPRGPSARGGDATGGTARLEATGGAISVSQLIDLVSSAHGGEGTTIGGGDAFGGTSAILIGPGGTLNGSSLTRVSTHASGGGAIGGAGTGGKGIAGTSSVSITGGATALDSITIEAFGIGGQGGDNASAGSGTGGATGLLVSGGTVNANQIELNGFAAGGFGGLGGAGGKATAGSARASFSGGSVTTGSLDLLAQANGGFGGNGGAGLPGGNGGDALGGSTVLTLSGDARVDVGNSFLSTGAFGGSGGAGGDGPTGGFGGGGGNGGAAVGGVSTITASGGSFVATDTHVDAVAHGGNGGTGGAGGIAGNSGGTGGDGAAGSGGIITAEAAGGALSFGRLSLIADGTGGDGQAGGDGATNPDGSVTTAPGGSAAPGGGGTVSIRAADNVATGSPGKFQGGDAFIAANGRGGFDSSGAAPVNGSAGRLLVAAQGSVPGGSLGFRSLFGSARGIASSAAPVFDLRSNSQVVTIDQSLNILADGDALVQTGVGAQISVLGDLHLDMSGSIAIESLDSSPTASPAIKAGNLFLNAGGDIGFNAAALVQAASGLLAHAGGSLSATRLASGDFLNLDGGTVTIANATAAGDIDIQAVDLLSAGTLAAGGEAFLGSSNGSLVIDDLNAADAFLSSAADTRFASIAATGEVGVATFGGSILGGTIDAGGHVVLLAADRVDTGGVRTGGALYVANASMLAPTDPSGTLADFLTLPPVATGGAVRFTGAVDADRLILSSGGTVSLSGLTVQSDISLAAGAGDLTVGDLATTGSIALTAATGKLTAGTLASGLDIGLSAAGALTTGSLKSGGGTALSSQAAVIANGAIEVAGAFNAKGSSIAIDASGSLRVNSAVATGGAASITSGGDLDVTGADALTDLTLISRNGALRSGALVAGGNLRLAAAGLATLDGATGAATIAIDSSDIAITGTANIAASASLSLTSTSGTGTTIGGTGSVSGYSLDAAEFARLSAPKWTIAAPGNVTLLDLTIAGSAAASPILTGPSATLRIQSSGTLQVAGKLLLADAGAADRIELEAAERLGVATPTGGIVLKNHDGALAGTLALRSDNIVIASNAAAADLASATDIAARKDRLAVNDGAASSAGYLEAGAISLAAGRTLYVQNSGTATEPAGLTAGAGGLSVSAVGAQRTEMILYGRSANADGSFVTGEAFIPAVTRSTGFDVRSTINGCFLVGPCLGAPPEPVQQAIAATVDTVVAVIASAQASDSGAGGGGGEGGGGAPSSSQSVTRAPNIVLGELLDFTPFKMQGPIEGPVTGAGTDDPGSVDLPPLPEPR